MSNGAPIPGHVSKLPIRSLLYPGSTTKIYARLVPFFVGDKKHVDVRYRSDNPEQVRRQVADMVSRGIDGAILDWYGRNHPELAKIPDLLRDEAEKQGFSFVLSEDQGAVKKCVQSGCDPTQFLIDELNYANQRYEQSSAYVRINGRPVVFFFDVNQPNIDWGRIRSEVKENPIFVFRNASAFDKPMSDGAFAWVDHGDHPFSQFYQKFQDTKRRRPAVMFAGVYKGFDDSAASWGKNQLTPQNCGQTWLDSFNIVNRFFSPSNPLDSVQIVTWNDYEEGTEIETGIDACLDLKPSLNGHTLNWDVSGNERAVDHYVVYASTDGQNLTQIAQVPSGTHSADLRSGNLPSGQYQVFVQAVGKPSILDKMSPSVTWNSGSK